MSKAENEWRVDGPDKVMGRTLYVDDLRRADLGFEMLHAVIVTSTIAKGRITKINTAKADALQGALLHKSVERRVSPFPGRTYPTASVTGMPSAV